MKPFVPDQVDLLRRLAQQHRLELELDPFHGARAYEFRSRINGKFRCLGVIFGPELAEVYRRCLDRRNEFIHKRLWFLEWLLPAVPAANAYEVIDRMHEEEVSQYFEKLLAVEFGQPR